MKKPTRKGLPAELAEKWNEAARHPGREVDVGRIVVCDGCDEDYTDSDARGGIIFGSNAYCPACAPRIERSAIKYGEGHYIKARAFEGQGFADFVREYRWVEGSNYVSFKTGGTT